MGQKQSVLTTPEITAGSNGSSQQQQQHAHAITSNDNDTGAMIESRSNPPPEDASAHNFGQPILPPHHSSSADASTSIEKRGASQLVTDCRVQQRASLSCIEENYDNKNVACAEYFVAYKNCRKEEHARKLEANARASAW